jgi:DNA (cytosine-5)-methyltransferase 1
LIAILTIWRCRSDGSKKNFAVLDLFSGIGGFSLGLEAAGPFRTVAFCEQDAFCQAVLRKHWPDVPIHDDVRTIDADGYRGIDILCGGFPCQPWSAAGEQRGAEDDRDLWPVMASLIADIRPQWVIGENVRGFVNQPLGLQRSLSDLESLGYQAAPFIIPACAVDAPHRRDRVWIIAAKDDADTNGKRHIERNSTSSEKLNPLTGKSVSLDRFVKFWPDAETQASGTPQMWPTPTGQDNPQVRGVGKTVGTKRGTTLGGAVRMWPTPAAHEARLGYQDRTRGKKGTQKSLTTEVIDDMGGRQATIGQLNPTWVEWLMGFPIRVDRLRALGNAVVPQVVTQIGRAILAAEGA